jgi:hypothetical protein
LNEPKEEEEPKVNPNDESKGLPPFLMCFIAIVIVVAIIVVIVFIYLVIRKEYNIPKKKPLKKKNLDQDADENGTAPMAQKPLP